MRDDKRLSKEEDAAPQAKKKRMNESPSHGIASSALPLKSRTHIPMSERQQFALLRQMKTEEAVDRSTHEPTTPNHQLLELLQTIKNGDFEALKHLVKTGTNVDAQDETGWSVLHELSSRNLPRQVAYLLRHGANPNLVGPNGDTPLHSAVRANNARVVRTLLRYNANQQTANKEGDRPMDLVHSIEVGQLLDQKTASEGEGGGGKSHGLSDGGAAVHTATTGGQPASDASSKLQQLQPHRHQPGGLHTGSSSSGTTYAQQQHSYHHHHHNYHGHYQQHGGQQSLSSASHSGQATVEARGSSISVTQAAVRSTSSDLVVVLDREKASLLTSEVADDKAVPGEVVEGEEEDEDDAILSDADNNSAPKYTVVTTSNATNTTTNSVSSSSGNQKISENLSTGQQQLWDVVTLPGNTNGSAAGKLITASALATANITGGSKKDPYAFEDDSDDPPGLAAGVLHQPPSISPGPSGFGKCSNCNSSDSPNQAAGSRGAATSTGRGAATTGGTVVTSQELNDPASTGGLCSAGPPLRLRFAKEAGQYTLMEQQQQQFQDVSEPDGHLQEGDEIGAAGGDAVLVSTRELAREDSEAVGSDASVPRLDSALSGNSVSHSMEVSEPVSMDDGNGSAVDTHPTATDLSEEQVASSGQKVPPLRIKFASGAGGEALEIPGDGSRISSITTTSSGSFAADQPLGVSIHTFGSLAPPAPLSSIVTATVHSDLPQQKDMDTVKSSQSLGGRCQEHSHDSSTDTNSILEHADRGDPFGDTRKATANDTDATVPCSCPPGASSATPAAAGEELSSSSSGGEGNNNNTGGQPGVGAVRGKRVQFHPSVHGDAEAGNRLAVGDSVGGETLAQTPAETGKEVTETKTDLGPRQRSGRTLRSHTAAAAQREKEEKERHTDVTPIKKRKLRSRSDNTTNANNNTASSTATSEIGANNNSSSTVWSSQPTDQPVACSDSKPPAGPSPTLATPEPCPTSASQNSCDLTSTTEMSIEDGKPNVSSSETLSLMSEEAPRCITVSPNTSTIASSASVASAGVDEPLATGWASSAHCDESRQQTPVPSGSGAGTSLETGSCDQDNDRSMLSSDYLFCPCAPDDEGRRDRRLLAFENPYDKCASLQKRLRELISNLVEVHPKQPCGYQDYLLVSRNYLLAHQTAAITKRAPPPHLEPSLVELFNEQEEERHAQALKHQSEREHLRLCAEQAVLRAQTRAALAVANLSKPLSFCSVLAYRDLTYVPPSKTSDQQREEENVRDRFTPRTFIGWLQDIKDTFKKEKKKMLCRQLHEAESLMMVQKLDWEFKLRESRSHDYTGVDVFKEIPPSHVPLIQVPNDFRLFVHDPVHRSMSM